MIDNENAAIVGANVKRLRLKKGMLQKDLGNLTGWGDANTGRFTICRIEQGRSSIPAEKLPKFAAALDAPIEAILSRTSGMDDYPKEGASVSDFLSAEEMELLDRYRELNDKGRDKLLSFADDLICTGKYPAGKDDLIS